MCLAVPGKIVEISEPDDAPAMGRIAVVNMHGNRIEASLAMTPEAGKGDWVLVHAGFALAVLDEAEARETWEALQLALGDGGESEPSARGG